MTADSGTPAATHAVLLHQLFASAASRWPQATAIDVPPGLGRPERLQLSYARLRDQASLISAALEPDLAANAFVAVMLGRDATHLYAAQLGVLGAGAAFVCIDPAFPDAHVLAMLEDSGAVALLTDTAGARRCAALVAGAPSLLDVLSHCRVIDVPGLLDQMPATPLAWTPPAWADGTNTAYMVYTSGTTGRPKGVKVAHASIVQLVSGDIAEFGLTVGDRVAQGSSPAYDSSAEETWLALAVGATVVVLDDETVRLGPDLAVWLRDEHIGVFCPPPTLLRTLGLRDPRAFLPELKLLYVGGEALHHDVADLWAPGRRMVNGYGPTECTVTATRAEVVAGAEISIGRPVPGLQAWVLDPDGAELPDGSPGELCFGGVGLAQGYHQRPDLTAEKFPQHLRLGRIYRTGDLAQRQASGDLVFLGRIDSQVKLRGYRIELEAVEAALALCAGVAEAAVSVQDGSGEQQLAAFVVPLDAQAPPDFQALRRELALSLPSYMVPSRFALLTTLPRSVGGKLKRDALPANAATLAGTTKRRVAASTEVQKLIAAAMVLILKCDDGVSIEDDFFMDLGGSSVLAALLISALRQHASTSSLTVRDVYEARTASAMARRAEASSTTLAPDAPVQAPQLPRHPSHPIAATVVQSTWLVLELTLACAYTYGLAFALLPWVSERLSPVVLILLAPLLGFVGLAAHTVLALFLTWALKRWLVGSYRASRVPVWGHFYVRHWVVVQAARAIPWALLAGTELQCLALRILGARIGHRVHIHRGVNLHQGGWDLLDIGDDVTVAQDASLRVMELEQGHLIFGRVVLHAGATLQTRAGVGPATVVGQGAVLTALSSLPAHGHIPAGEQWQGVPAVHVGFAPPLPTLSGTASSLSPWAWACALLLGELLLVMWVTLPLEGLALGFVLGMGLDAPALAQLLLGSALTAPGLAVLSVGLVVSLIGGLVFEALAIRALGRVQPGVLPRWSLGYLRVWLKSALVESAGAWLSGSLLWPHWLRLAGMRVGAGCEISTILCVVPELVDIGPTVFFADGVYLGAPELRHGTVVLGGVSVGENTFVGNHAVIAAGQHLAADILIGVCTVADDRLMRAGSAWFGMPAFELPQRQVEQMDRTLTHEPSTIRLLNRWFWESLRFALPILPVLVVIGWFRCLDAAYAAVGPAVFFLLVAPALGLGAAILVCVCLLALKWALLGRVKPGSHALWSCWCSRWDFLYVAWRVWARASLASLEGSLLLNAWLRCMGVSIGKRVALGPGFSQVIDPDMLHFDDDASVSAMFQAHTFEDRLLKIDHVRVGRGATLSHATVPLYGADIGAGTVVAAHSVVMKHEHLLPGLCYEGAPTQARPRQRANG